MVIPDYNKKRILVTGGTGFVGGHLIETLIDMGAYVIATHHVDTPVSYFSSRALGKKAEVITIDITQYEVLHRLILDEQCELIFHLAAQPLVERAYDTPRETLQTNISGTINILEAVRHCDSIKGVIIASSDKAYGQLKKDCYFETDPLHGTHPYDVSKSAADLIAQSYASTYGLPVVVTRFGNIYGPGDVHLTRIIPSIMHALIENHKLEVRSDGTHIRDYLHVKDVVAGYLILAGHIKETAGKAYNFGSSDTYSVTDLIRICESVLHVTVPYCIMNTATRELSYQHLDYTKVHQAYGWVPHIDLKSSLPDIYKWYKTYQPW